MVIEGETHTMLCRLDSVRDGRSATIFEAVKQLLASLGLEATQIVGLGSDGASAMLGRYATCIGLVLTLDPDSLV